MAWYCNHYQCYRCHKTWTDEWSCGCNDECPYCGAKDTSPHESDDLTFIIEDEGHCFIVFKSSENAEHGPDYGEVNRFLSKDFAEAYIRAELEKV